jgi:hypothetical protein
MYFQYKQQIGSKSLWRWYINTNIMFLDIIHRPAFVWNTQRFRDKIQSSKRCVLNKNRTMDNVQKQNIWTNWFMCFKEVILIYGGTR